MNQVSRRKKNQRRTEQGFTLVELVAVVIILGILAGGAALGINARIQSARVQSTVTQISQIGQAINLFHLDCGFYPDSMEALLSPPTSGRQCKNYTPGGYLEKKELPKDPWSNPYNYASPGLHDTDRYDLWSNGPDGDEGTSDDINSWASEKVE